MPMGMALSFSVGYGAILGGSRRKFPLIYPYPPVFLPSCTGPCPVLGCLWLRREVFGLKSGDFSDDFFAYVGAGLEKGQGNLF